MTKLQGNEYNINNLIQVNTAEQEERSRGEEDDERGN